MVLSKRGVEEKEREKKEKKVIIPIPTYHGKCKTKLTYYVRKHFL